MMRIVLFASAALALAACSGEGDTKAEKSAAAPPAAATPAAPGAMTPAAFITAVGQSDLYEVRSSRMARTRAPNIEVKRFAQKMMDAHTQTTYELGQLVAGVPGSGLPASPSADQVALLEALRKSSPTEFEALYLQQQTDAHTKALALLEGYAANGDNEALKAFAAKTAPAVKEHLDMLAKLSPAAPAAAG